MAKESGIRAFRFFASLYGANAEFAFTNSETYWEEYDRWFEVIESLGLYVVPSLGAGEWFHTTVNETLNDEITNPSSLSQRRATQYAYDFVSRYGNRTSVLLGQERVEFAVNLPEKLLQR